MRSITGTSDVDVGPSHDTLTATHRRSTGYTKYVYLSASRNSFWPCGYFFSDAPFRDPRELAQVIQDKEELEMQHKQLIEEHAQLRYRYVSCGSLMSRLMPFSKQTLP